MTNTNQKVETVEQLTAKIAEVRAAQELFSSYSQERVDEIFRAAAMAANVNRIPLAKMAVAETGMGIVEDKVIKNHYAAEYIYNQYKDAQTCGELSRDDAMGTRVIAEPIGVVAAVIPTTNPTSTAIFKALLALKTRNGIIFSPHPKAKNCTIEAAKIILDAAVAAGAPKSIIGWIDTPSLELTNEVMKSTDMILATGGPGMVRAAYSSGKPAIGVGAGNVPAVFHKTCDIQTAVSSVILSKTFDNGMICASEQSVIVDKTIYNEVKAEFIKRGCYVLSAKETEKVRKTIIINGALNAKIVGQSAFKIAELAGVAVAPETKILIGEVTSVETTEEFAHEKLSPVLAMYKYTDFSDAAAKADKLVKDGGYGHTASIFIDTTAAAEDLKTFENTMKACRIVINTPAAHGGIGDLYNFALAPSLTLGCGSYGGNSVSENVGVKHLINTKTVAERRENMLWFRTPEKVYFKRGCLAIALKELKEVYNKKRVFIVTDEFLYKNGNTKAVEDLLDDMGVSFMTFFDVEPDPTLATTKKGAEAMRNFEPDCIVAFGGGSAMDAAKIMWTLYEHSDVNFHDLAMRFMDIRKRVFGFPKLGIKANFVAIPTTAGTGSEATPFAVITDEKTGVKYPLADYELLPSMAIVDADLMMNMPKGLTAASGFDVLTHALEAYASMLASEYTDGLALNATKLVFKYLPSAYAKGAADPIAREKMADASALAGMAFANAFLGLCHSMAHKLGSFHHLPHGIANALLITEIIRFNMTECPTKMGAFSQYKYPRAAERYAELASFIGLRGKDDNELCEKLIAEIEKLKSEIELKPSIKAYGVKEEDFMATLDDMTEQAFDDQCTGANPRYPLMSEIKELYLKAYHGK